MLVYQRVYKSSCVFVCSGPQVCVRYNSIKFCELKHVLINIGLFHCELNRTFSEKWVQITQYDCTL